MKEFFEFLSVAAEYYFYWDWLWNHTSGYYDDQGNPQVKKFEVLYAKQVQCESNVLAYLVVHGVYSPYDVETQLKIIRKAFEKVEPTIIECKILPPHEGLGVIAPHQVRYQATVVCQLSDGTETVAFRYFVDELHFVPNEFVGLTVDEAVSLFHKRYIEYLRS